MQRAAYFSAKGEAAAAELALAEARVFKYDPGKDAALRRHRHRIASATQTTTSVRPYRGVRLDHLNIALCLPDDWQPDETTILDDGSLDRGWKTIERKPAVKLFCILWAEHGLGFAQHECARPSRVRTEEPQERRLDVSGAIISSLRS
jgi:hypothetical protein